MTVIIQQFCHPVVLGPLHSSHSPTLCSSHTPTLPQPHTPSTHTPSTPPLHPPTPPHTLFLHPHTSTHPTPHTDGEFLRLMQIGTDLTKIKKKSYARIFRLEDDLLGITWNSRSKRSTKARSKWHKVPPMSSHTHASLSVLTHTCFTQCPHTHILFDVLAHTCLTRSPNTPTPSHCPADQGGEGRTQHRQLQTPWKHLS